MKIRYSRKRLYSNLLLGSLFGLFSFLKIIEGSANYFNYFQLVLGMVIVGSYFFERYYHYICFENGMLTKNSLRSNTIKIKDVVKIRSFPGKIKLFTSEKKLVINTGVIDEDSKKDLYLILGSLELGPEENPFIGYARN